MSELFERLMEHHSQLEDLKYIELLNPTFPSSIQKFRLKQVDYNQHHIQVKNQYIAESLPKRHIALPKTKKIQKVSSETSNSEDYVISSNSTKRKDRLNKARKQSYPTKNFLPNSKAPHIEFLQSYIGDQINQHDFIKYLREKDGVSMKDYQTLYKFPQFQEAFSAMFNSKYLYRALLLSRSSLQTKMIHQSKLHVFQQAFRTQQFNRIN